MERYAFFLRNHRVKSLSRVRLFATPWTVAYQAPPSMGFSRQEYWSGLPFPSPGDLPDPGIEPGSPALEADTLTSEPPGNRTLYNYKCTLGCKESFSEFHTVKIVWTILSALKLDGGNGYIKRISPVSLKKTNLLGRILLEPPLQTIGKTNQNESSVQFNHSIVSDSL